ncbi:MAG: glycosyltransferase [Gammaproteobacteria bacterium]|nr:glycosyltransferase [Gammaproteobacteria bacterium]
MLTLLKHLDRTQFSLSLVVINTRRSVHLGEVPRDVELIDFGSRRVRAALVKLMRLIRRRRPDVVFSTQGYLNLGIALIKPWLPVATRCLARETSIVSKVLHLHRRPVVLRFLYHRVYKRLDAVICQSRAMRDDLVAAYAFPAGKTVIIHNPVDVDWVRERAREKVELVGLKPGRLNLVTAGRLSPEKGLDSVIAALALCRMPNLNLVILGEGKLRAALEARASQLGVGGQVQFAGFQTNPYPWFAHADLFVLGSRSEGFPNVALEALACGTPLVATPCDSLADLGVDASDGLLARDFTPQALADAIQQAVARRADFSVSIERIRTKFGIDTIARQYRDLLLGSGREPAVVE